MTKQEFLAMSLPYRLKAVDIYTEKVFLCNAAYYSEEFECKNEYYNSKLILHPLSDITKAIEHKGKKLVPLRRLLKNNNFDLAKMSEEYIMSFEEQFIMPELITLNDLPLYLEWHFDIAGLIEKGEAIDVNTLPENPYK